jgi:hypothetical protein
MANKDWSDYFAAAYGEGGFSKGMELAFKKWQQEREDEMKTSPKYIAAQALPYVAAMGGDMNKLLELSKYNTVEEYAKANPPKKTDGVTPDLSNKEYRAKIFGQAGIPESEWKNYNIKPITRVVKGIPIQSLQPTLKTDTEMRAMRTRENFPKTINRLYSLLDTSPSKEGVAGRLSGLKQWYKGVIGENPNLTTYKDAKDVVVGQVASIIGGESGARLSDQDIERMRKAFSSEFETTTERKTKRGFFIETVNDIAASYGADPIMTPDMGGSVGSKYVQVGRHKKTGQLVGRTAEGKIEVISESR